MIMCKSILLCFLVIQGLGFNLYALNHEENLNKKVNELYREMHPNDLQFIKTSPIINEQLIKRLEDISGKDHKDDLYLKLLKGSFSEGIQIAKKQGLAEKQAVEVVSSHLRFIGNKFFSIKSMLMIKQRLYKFKNMQPHRDNRKAFFTALNSIITDYSH